MTQMPGEQCCGSGAIDIVVAKDRDLFASHGRIRDALGGRLHLRHGVGVGQHLADGRIEKVLNRIDLDIAAREHARQHFRQLIALRNRKRTRSSTGIQPVTPQFPSQRIRHAEKGRRGFNGQCGCGERHHACGR